MTRPEYDGQRRHEQRITARVLVLDPDDHILLLEDSDLGAPGAPSFWLTPGGGLEGTETPESAAIRELLEETGLVVDPDQLQGPLGTRTVVHGYSDKVVIQDEVFFVVRSTRFEPSATALTPDEQATLRSTRWWSLADLIADHGATIWPLGLTELIHAASNPAHWPVVLSEAEESTVPAS